MAMVLSQVKGKVVDEGSELLAHTACLCPLLWLAFDPFHFVVNSCWTYSVGLTSPSSCWAVGLHGCLWPSTLSLPELRSQWGAVFKKVSSSSLPWHGCTDLCCDPPLRLLYTPHGISSYHRCLYHCRFCWFVRLRRQGVPPVWTCGGTLSFLKPHSRLAVCHVTWHRDWSSVPKYGICCH